MEDFIFYKSIVCCIFLGVTIFYPSAGARYPIETYLIANNIESLEKGLYEIYQFQRELDKKYGDKINLLETEVSWNLMHCDDPLMQASRKEGKYLGGCGAGFSGISVLSNGKVHHS